MVTTRASSRESTPAASTHGARATTRRSTLGPVEATTPGGRARPRRTGSQAVARAGHTSHAYGVGSQATASRVAARNLQGFSSALDEELKEAEEIQSQHEDPQPEPSPFLPPIAEDGRRESSRESTPASNVESSFSASSSALQADISKSFSDQRENGLRKVSGPARRDFFQPAQPHRPAVTQQGPLYFERIQATAMDLASGVKDFLTDHWKTLFGVLLALTIGSLLAIYGLPSPSSLVPSRPISEPGYPADYTTTVVSYISRPSDPAISNRLKNLESRVNNLEDELSRAKTDGALTTIPFNHISASIGATIIPAFTSPTKRTVSNLLSPLAKIWTPPGTKGPLTALMAWSEPGQCWCTPADRASLAVRAPYPVQASAVTIEHITRGEIEESGHGLETAPSLVEIWARGGDADTNAGDCLGEKPGVGWTCLGRMDLRQNGEDIRYATKNLYNENVVSQDFVFRVLENKGGAAATCLYRVQLHGEKE